MEEVPKRVAREDRERRPEFRRKNWIPWAWWTWRRDQSSTDAPPHTTPRAEKIRDQTHPAILRLQGLNALGDVAIVDVVAVDFHEVFEGGGLVAGGLVGGSQFVVEGDAGFSVDAGNLQSLVIPADGRF